MMFISFAGVMTGLLGISGFVMFSGLMMVFGRFLVMFNYPVIRSALTVPLILLSFVFMVEGSLKFTTPSCNFRAICSNRLESNWHDVCTAKF